MISACVPCLNHWNSLPLAIEGIRRQTVPPKEILVIDDGSLHPCPRKLSEQVPELRIIRLKENLGRGFCRALAVNETVGDFILTVDATNTLEPTFVEKALPHFTNPAVAAVSGALTSINQEKVTDRWRARHLFRESSLKNAWAEPCSMLITYGTILRREAIEKVGNFDASLRFKEDQDMGDRLAEAGYVVVGDPSLKVFPTVSNTISQLLERYARWYMEPNEKPSLRGYFHNILAAFRPMIEADLRERDWKSAIISMLSPHYQLYYSFKAYRTSNRKPPESFSKALK